MSLNLLEPFLDESLSEEAKDFEVVHMGCGACHLESGYDYAFCGEYVGDADETRGAPAPDYCVMCVETKKGFKRMMGLPVCPKGHLLNP